MSELDAFPHPEAQLAERFGLPRSFFRDKRKAQPEQRGTQWIRLDGVNGVFAWSEAAVKELAASLGVENGAGGAQDMVPAPKTAPTPMRVAQARLCNTRLIACVPLSFDPANRELWRLVRVRDASRFIPGMEILAEAIEGSSMWRFLGRPGQPEGTPVRYPRGKGRW